MKAFCKWILKLMGWKVDVRVDFPNKCVICAAPHTSNWDLPIGLIAYTSIGQRASFLIKKSWFFFPLNILFNALGGIKVDRSKSTSMTDQVVQVFNSKPKFQLAVTPEGTRKANSEWKKGFYYIALAAQVPILVAAFDYKLKTIIIMEQVVPTGDADKDIAYIKSLYKGVTAKYPEKFFL